MSYEIQRWISTPGRWLFYIWDHVCLFPKKKMLEFQWHRQNYQKWLLSGNQKSEKSECTNSRNSQVVGN